MLIDFANAFNSCNRNLLIKFVVAAVPEIAFWFYADETELFLSKGDTGGLHLWALQLVVCPADNIFYETITEHTGGLLNVRIAMMPSLSRNLLLLLKFSKPLAN